MTLQSTIDEFTEASSKPLTKKELWEVMKKHPDYDLYHIGLMIYDFEIRQAVIWSGRKWVPTSECDLEEEMIEEIREFELWLQQRKIGQHEYKCY